MNKLLLAVGLMLGAVTGFAEPVTPQRIGALPPEQRVHWQSYLDRSRTNAQLDQAALDAELSVKGLASAIRAPFGSDFRIPAKSGDAWFESEEARELANTVLSFQTPSGGWSKHTDYTKGPRRPGMQWTSQNEPGKRPHYLATFDNRATTEETHFLAQMWLATTNDIYAKAVSRSIGFILAAQYPNGGWPQVYPLEGDYHDDLTFNDNAITRILELLAVTGHSPAFAFLEPGLHKEVASALRAGIQCVLQTQISQGGRKTGWCAQYDAITLKPSSARKMEPPTLGGPETADILKFLMNLPKPSPEVVACIESGLAWLDKSKITGISRRNKDGKTVYEPDAASTEVYWARFYDLTTNEPVFPGRDGVLYKTFNEMAARNKVGYDYYSTQPGSVLNTTQKKWRKSLKPGS